MGVRNGRGEINKRFIKEAVVGGYGTSLDYEGAFANQRLYSTVTERLVLLYKVRSSRASKLKRGGGASEARSIHARLVAWSREYFL